MALEREDFFQSTPFLRWTLVAGLVFVAFALYAIHEWFFTDHAFRLVGPRSESSPRNALLGLLMVGVPCLIYALRGGRKPPVRIERNFADRPAVEQAEILQHTWCNECDAPDLGMHTPVEYEEAGGVYVQGMCSRCGSVVATEVATLLG